MSIERTTSANSTVTCLYSAAVAAGLTGAPHLLQNRESGGSSVPHDPHNCPAAVTAPRPSQCRPRQYRVTLLSDRTAERTTAVAKSTAAMDALSSGQLSLSEAAVLAEVPGSAPPNSAALPSGPG